jgi:diadenosine tetraphosphate (Ap4A) HIT family hydrolase
VNSTALPCELCATPGGVVLWDTPSCRVVRVDDPHYPGFCRVIWNAHVREMSDLDRGQQQYLMSVVFAVEAAVRKLFMPDKINLASFGNMVPHVHWHVIPRWADDRHFPEPVWGAVRREGYVQRVEICDEALKKALALELAAVEH